MAHEVEERLEEGEYYKEYGDFWKVLEVNEEEEKVVLEDAFEDEKYSFDFDELDAQEFMLVDMQVVNNPVEFLLDTVLSEVMERPHDYGLRGADVDYMMTFISKNRNNMEY